MSTRRARRPVRRSGLGSLQHLSVEFADELRADLLEVTVGCAEICTPTEEAFEVEVSVVLPREADAAEHLNRGVADGGEPARERLCPQRGTMPLRGIGCVGRPQRVNDAASGEFDGL